MSYACLKFENFVLYHGTLGYKKYIFKLNYVQKFDI